MAHSPQFSGMPNSSSDPFRRDRRVVKRNSPFSLMSGRFFFFTKEKSTILAVLTHVKQKREAA
jgi:hypothetical protein